MADSRSKNKKVVSVPMPLALLAAVEEFARQHKIDRVAAINGFLRERLNLPECEDARYLMKTEAARGQVETAAQRRAQKEREALAERVALAQHTVIET